MSYPISRSTSRTREGDSGRIKRPREEKVRRVEMQTIKHPPKFKTTTRMTTITTMTTEMEMPLQIQKTPSAKVRLSSKEGEVKSKNSIHPSQSRYPPQAPS